MRVLIPRPREDGAALAKDLAELGIESLIEPMFDVVHVPSGAPSLHGAQAILLTSANGARALAALSTVRWVPVLAVGDATARAARDLGFIKVESADGDVETLARLATERLDPKAGKLIHVAGTTVAGDLSGTLTAAGFTVDRAVLYEARPRRAMSPEAMAALRDRTVDGVLFFSPRTAATFVSVAREARLTESCRHLVAYCLSQAVADAANSLPWQAVTVAARPTQQALLEAVTSSTELVTQPSAQPEKGPDMSEDGNSEDKSTGAGGEALEPVPASSGKAAADIVQLFGGIRPMAHKLGIAVTTVQGWKERGVIPAARHEQVLSAARDHGIALEAADLTTPTATKSAPAKASDSKSPPPRSSAPESPASAAAPSPSAPTPSVPAPGRAAAQASAATPATASASAKPAAAPSEIQSPPKATMSASPPTGAKSSPERSGGSVPPASTKPKTPPPKKRSPVLAYAVIAVLVAGGSYIWWQVTSSDETTRTAAAPDDGTTANDAGTQAAAPTKDASASDPDDVATEDAASTAPSAPPAETDDGRGTETAASPEATDAQASAPSAAEPSAPAAPPGIDEAKLTAALASRDVEIAALRSDTERLTAALRAATTRLAAVERKAAERPPAIVSAGDPQAAGLVLAVGLLREAVRGSDAYTAELETLRALAAEDPEIAAALAPIEAHAAEGIPTRSQLQERFSDLATAVVRAGALPADPGWMDRVTHQLATLVSIRRTGPNVPGDGAEARVARAEAAMNDGNLRAAVESLTGLQGSSAAAAEGWLGDAQARLAAADAVRRLQGLVIGRLSPDTAAVPDAAPSADDSASGG